MTDDDLGLESRRLTDGDFWFDLSWALGAGPSRESTCLTVGFLRYSRDWIGLRSASGCRAVSSVSWKMCRLKLRSYGGSME